MDHGMHKMSELDSALMAKKMRPKGMKKMMPKAKKKMMYA